MARINLRRKRSGPLDLRFSIAAGAAADTNIAVAGIKRGDGLVAVIHVADGAEAALLKGDLVAETNITSDGNIQVDTTVTTGDQLLVIWVKR